MKKLDHKLGNYRQEIRCPTFIFSHLSTENQKITRIRVALTNLKQLLVVFSSRVKDIQQLAVGYGPSRMCSIRRYNGYIACFH